MSKDEDDRLDRLFEAARAVYGPDVMLVLVARSMPTGGIEIASGSLVDAGAAANILQLRIDDMLGAGCSGGTVH